MIIFGFEVLHDDPNGKLLRSLVEAGTKIMGSKGRGIWLGKRGLLGDAEWNFGKQILKEAGRDVLGEVYTPVPGIHWHVFYRGVILMLMYWLTPGSEIPVKGFIDA